MADTGVARAAVARHLHAALNRPPWHQHARCRRPGMLGLFFTSDDASAELARVVCTRCPVIAECRAWAAVHRPSAGVWAGELHHPKPRRDRSQRRPTADGTDGL